MYLFQTWTDQMSLLTSKVLSKLPNTNTTFPNKTFQRSAERSQALIRNQFVQLFHRN